MGRPSGSKTDRRRLALQRRASERPDRDRLDTAICAAVVEWVRHRATAATSVIVRYDPLPGEPDVRPIETTLTECRFALTRTPEVGRDLTVHPSRSRLERHRFGYHQPVAGSPIIDDAEIDLVLVPGLVFDRWGNRLGFGAGYYDRFLGRLGNAVRMGVCDQVSDERLPTEPHDVVMTHLATPEGVVEVRSTTT